MSSTYLPRPLPYQPIANPGAANPIGFNNSGDPRKVAQNQRQLLQGQGDALQSGDADLANQYRTAAGGTESYLNNVEDPLAQGNGGYNSTESSAINYSPEDLTAINYSPEERQRIVTGAGISAGAGTASAVGAAERAAAATGGNPLALATYRARAAQTQGANAGDAMTQARIAAKNAEGQARIAAKTGQSQGAQTTGNARLGQQNQALQYYQGLQGQQNQNAQNEQGLQHGAFGTTAGATNDATKQVIGASQTPSTFDKVLGAASGALSAFKLEDGTAGYLGHDDEGVDAIIGEDGPEAIVEAASRPTGPRGAMADGGYVGQVMGYQQPPYVSTGGETEYNGGPTTPMWEGPPPGIMQPPGEFGQTKPGMLQRVKSTVQSAFTPHPQPQSGQEQPQWNKATPYQQFGQALGGAASRALDHGGDAGGEIAMANGYRATRMADGGVAPPKIVTSPTHVRLAPGDAVVPLSYRAKAKVRPSYAMAAMGAQPRA